MRALSITEPLPIPSLGGTLPLVARLLTPNPREASGAVAQAGAYTIDIDYGAPVTMDTIFVGYVYASSFPAMNVGYGTDGFNNTPPPVQAAPTAGAPFRHYFLALPAPVPVRFLRLTLNLPAGARVGTLATGLSIAPQWGYEYDSGRPVIDTGSATRLKDGSFGIDEGVAVGGFDWTFGELSDDETAKLYWLARRRRTTRSVLVVEDPDFSDGLGDRIHWGLFTKLEPYARYAPGATRWALRVEDWA